MSLLLFWLLLVAVLWSLFGYGLVWMGLARLFGRRAAPSHKAPHEFPLHVTMLIAARNEAAVIRDKLESVLAQDVGPHRLDVLVVSDGSDDATLAQALSLGAPAIDGFPTRNHCGKARALTAGLARISADVVVFSDANSLLVPGALRHLLRTFAGAQVGGTCGQPRPRLGRGGWLAPVEALFWAMRGLMNPRRHGLYAVQLICHKLLRRLVAFLLPLLLAANVLVAGQGWFPAVTLAAQTIVCLLAAAAIWLPGAGRLPGAGQAAFFVLGHAAMALGIVRAGLGVRSSRWVPVREDAP